ncbi:MAG: 50S ribosomal protein L6 [Chloroflexi bacterium]|nr:50S ribosomal protein L6 [Chloroflexota bacterium]MCY3937735.1 50S ribosomal protein L6 [Chloroflexota bacterium]
MSRVGARPIPIPDGVKWSVDDGGLVEVSGSLGRLSLRINPSITLHEAEGEIRVQRVSDSRRHKEMHGLYRSLIANMVEGVSKGFSKQLEIQGVGYRAQMQGGRIEVQLGFSHPVFLEAPDGLDYVLDGQTRLTVKGIDKELVGREAARIRALRPPDPYKGKGIRYVGEDVKTKPGKAAVTAGIG